MCCNLPEIEGLRVHTRDRRLKSSEFSAADLSTTYLKAFSKSLIRTKFTAALRYHKKAVPSIEEPDISINSNATQATGMAMLSPDMCSQLETTTVGDQLEAVRGEHNHAPNSAKNKAEKGGGYNEKES